jgi:WD40 repeat protein
MREGLMTERSECSHDLFISHAEADRAWVEGYLLDALNAAGVRCHSEEAFRLGVPRLLEFERAVQQSKRTLLVLSPAYLAEGLSQFSDLLAQSYGLESATWPVIPLLLHPVQLPPRLAMLTALDATDPADWADVVERLCAELQCPVPDSVTKPPCPYPGMMPFSERDSHRFFGRDQEVQELVEQLRLHPFLAVVGPSGSGKSSLVFAGLVPALRKTGLFGTGEWLVRSLRPGESPHVALDAALGSGAGDAAGAVTALLSGQPQARRLLLVVDQFEELFTLAHKEHVRPFQQALQHLIEVPNCYVVLTVRADFYPELMATPLWGAIQAHRFEVLLLNEGNLRQAIVRPAEDVRVFVETALVERLVSDAGQEPGVLPLVQETLVLLWERLERCFLPLRAYEALVLTRRAYGEPPLTGLQAAMARRADAALADLPPQQQAIARHIFLRLVQFGEGRADTRRQQPAEALRTASDDLQAFSQTLRHLEHHRLLTLSGEEESGQRTVDIAHEALISGWPTLQEWLGQRREAEQTRRRLEAKAQEWIRLGRAGGGLLDRVELMEAERWLMSPDSADLGVSEALPAFMEASQAAIEAARQEREAARRQALELERQNAEEQRRRAEAERRRAEEHARASSRLRRLAAVLAAVFVLAVMAALFALAQQQEARGNERLALTSEARALANEHRALTSEAQALANEAQVEQQLRLATSRDLATSAISKLAVDPELSILLAMQAVSVTYAIDREVTEAAENALHQALEVSRIRLTLAGHTEPLSDVAYSPDGTRLATSSGDRTIKVWDASSGELLFTIAGQRVMQDVAYSPDGTRLASADADGRARIWDAVSGTPVLTLTGHSDALWGVAYNPAGTRVATASSDRTVRVWDAISGTAVLTLTGHSDQVHGVAFGPEGALLATASNDGTARVWDALSGQELYVLEGHTGKVSAVAFSPDGKYLATASAGDGTAKVWDLATGQETTMLSGHRPSQVYRVAFSPDGQCLVTSSADKTAKAWQTGTWREMFTLVGHTDSVWGLAFSPDGTRLATASRDGTARVWDVSPGNGRLIISAHDGELYSLAFSPDGLRLASAGQDRAARVWDLPSGTPALTLTGHDDEVLDVAFSGDGKYIATASKDGTARLWDAASGDLVHPLEGHNNWVFAVAFRPDSRCLATTTYGLIRGWDVPSGDSLFSLTGHTAEVRDAVFSPDGGSLYTVSNDKTVRVWDLASAQGPGEPLALEGHNAVLTAVAVSTDGRFLATAGEDNTVKVWNTGSWVERFTLTGHTNFVRAVAFHPDGTRLATASFDGTTKVWSLETGQELFTLSGHESGVQGVAFSPDGKRLGTAGQDGTVHLYVLDIDELMALARTRVTRSLSLEECRQYLHLDECPPTP